MDDFYAVAGVGRTAPAEEIDKKIREQLRIWQRRTTNADLSRRQEAERRVQLLGEARITLLDPAKRQRYDHQLGDVPTTTSVAPAGAETADVDWLAKARRHLSDNNYHSAAHAARQARDLKATAEAWGLLSRASAGMHKLDDALYEARQAVSVDEQSAQAWLDLGFVYEQRGEWREAFEQYEVAGRLDPQAEAPEAGMTRSLASYSNPTEAVDRLERRFAVAPPAQRRAAGRMLGKALVTAAERVARGPSRGQFRINTQGQVDEIGRLLARARQVTSDPGVVRMVAELELRVVRIRQSSPTAPPRPTSGGPTTGSFRPTSGGPTTGSFRSPSDGTGSWKVPSRTNNLAIASFVVSLAGLLLCVAAPAGAIMGHVARTQIRERGEQGDGLALAGIVIGWLITVIVVCGVGIVLSTG